MWRWLKKVFRVREEVQLRLRDDVPTPKEEFQIKIIRRDVMADGVELPYKDFKIALGRSESSSRYDAKNKFGFLGKYQFGLARLADFGLCVQRKPGLGNKNFAWKVPYTEEFFLHTPMIQEMVFDAHVGSHRKFVMEKFGEYVNTTVNKQFLSLSGAIACCHLLGAGGLRAFIKGQDHTDANGMAASTYIARFRGYAIPATLPTSVDLTIAHNLALEHAERG